ncbi:MULTISPECIES: flagellar biosynthesis anti-sigma factor FlgM [Legionella]|uniref:Negative regulator of flagellin synthesis n=1 Tax=Legionella donaldsonii TaxID=45060 RepID=A0A378J2T5_9GAMM|nr:MULTISPECIES: flagellar biosynthesis anti-sigma factor FlgM [Legionella]MCC5015308.1 flagellar biosynthesis anti-sigma factor FlgM [Legionella sp. 31fI33]STX42043.1 negative regulator of flagellin synthesis FlgM [Legionella donaldsonii]
MSAIESNVMVNPINESGNFKRLEADSRPQRTQPAAQESHAEETNLVSRSDTLKQIDALKEFIRDAQEIDQERVAFFKEELAAGQYHIRSDNIAQKIIADLEVN